MSKRAKRRIMNNDGLLYVGVDVHERESQLAVLKEEGSLVLEERIPTKDLKKFVSSLPGEKRVAIESVGFIHPIYKMLSSVEDCTVSVANPNKLRLIAESSTKNDYHDARILGDLLRTNYLPLAHTYDKFLLFILASICHLRPEIRLAHTLFAHQGAICVRTQAAPIMRTPSRWAVSQRGLIRLIVTACNVLRGRSTVSCSSAPNSSTSEASLPQRPWQRSSPSTALWRDRLWLWTYLA